MTDGVAQLSVGLLHGVEDNRLQLLRIDLSAFIQNGFLSADVEIRPTIRPVLGS